MTVIGTSPPRIRQWMRHVWPAFLLSPSEDGSAFGWLTAHPAVVDVGMAAALAALGCLLDAFKSPRPAAALAWDLALAVPLVWRRRHLATAAALTGAICLAQWYVGTRASGDVAVLVVLYSLGVYERRRWILLTAVLTAELGVVMAVTRWAPPSNRLVVIAMATGTVTAAWMIGVYLRMRRAYQASNRERVERETFDLDEYAYDGLRAGASGFLLKNVRPAQLVAGIRSVAAGEAVLAPSATRRLVDTYVDQLGVEPGPTPEGQEALNSLTARESEVFQELAAGLTNKEIAGRLYLSEATVKTHVVRILFKLQLRDRVQAVIYAYETGIIRPSS